MTEEARCSGSTDRAASGETGFRRYLRSLKYSLYVITHPFDGFWDLSREKKGTTAAAHTMLALFLITYVLKLMYTNFQFIWFRCSTSISTSGWLPSHCRSWCCACPTGR